MSFWPFSSSYGSSSQLQKFLDSVTDYSLVTVDNIIHDRELQHEFLEELKSISAKSLKSNGLSFLQLINESQFKSTSLSNADNLSLTSSTNEGLETNNSLSKTARQQKLLEILLQPHILQGFIDYLISSVSLFAKLDNEQNENLDADSTEAEDEDNSEESKKETLHRRILCSAEVLSSDLWMISNRIIESPSLMGSLWLILDMPNLRESSPSVAYVVQILDHFMESNCIEMINFIRKQENLVDTFLGKIDVPIIMDFFLKVIHSDKADSPTGIIAVISQQGLIPKLIDLLKPASDGPKAGLLEADHLFMQTSATDFIKALVTISSNTSLAVDLDTNIGPNELTRELASPEIIQIMLSDIMLQRIPDPKDDKKTVPNKHGISNCVSIIIELIRKNNSDYDLNCGPYSTPEMNQDGASEVNIQSLFLWLQDLEENPPGPRDPIFLGDLLRIFSDNLQPLVDFMKEESLLDNKQTKVFGVTRYRMSELIAELLHCSNMILLNSKKIAELVKYRDELRTLRCHNILDALGGLAKPDSDSGARSIVSVINDIDVMSLESKPIGSIRPLSELFEDTVPIERDQDLRKTIKLMEFEDSDEEEPLISSENPFVCDERDELFRANPCIGDYFKINLRDLKMLETILQTFTDFPWHNFFHNVVFDFIQQIFNGKLNSYNSFLIVNLFDDCDLIGLIANSFKNPTKPRPGYMGHLILISEEVVKFTSLYKPALISPKIVDAVRSEDWDWFITECLLKTRELYNVILGTEPEFSESEDEGAHKADNDESSTSPREEAPQNSKKAIILGDSNNHDQFVAEKVDDEEDMDEESFPTSDSEMNGWEFSAS